MSGTMISDDGADGDAGLDIVVVDDTPDADRSRALAPDATESDDDIVVPPSEMDQYHANVKKRINNLSFKAASERRAKEAAVRERSAAVEFAGRVVEENNRLKRYSHTNETALVDTARARAEEQIETLKREAKVAFEAGDSDKFLDAQVQMQRRVSEHTRLAEYVPPQLVETPMPPRAPAAEPDPDNRAIDWMSRNPWFKGEGDDEAGMTGFALGVSDALIKKNVDPRTPAYYEAIDKAVRRTFPAYAGFAADDPAQDATGRRTSVVAAATRSAPARRTVHLTASQQTIARRLGLTLEQYAAQL